MGASRTTNMAEAAVAVVQSVNETGLTASQFDTIYNVTSFGLACMMASTCFFFLRLPSMTERYKEALCYTGLVTFIAFYHYYRIFNSFDAAFTPCEVVEGVVNPNKCSPTEFGYSPTGKAGLTAGSMVAIQVGYTVSDVISKCGVGFLVYNIACTKSAMERGDCEEECVKADV